MDFSTINISFWRSAGPNHLVNYCQKWKSGTQIYTENRQIENKDEKPHQAPAQQGQDLGEQVLGEQCAWLPPAQTAQLLGITNLATRLPGLSHEWF